MTARSLWPALLIAGCLLPGAAAARQKAPQNAPAAQPGAGETLDLGESQNRMTVPVSIGGQGPFEFVVDTGAERSVISRELAAALGLDAGSSARLVDFTGVSAVDTVEIPSLSVGSLGTGAMQAPALSRANLGAAGMLGIDALQGHRIVIDFNRDRMKVHPAKHHPRGEVVVEAEKRFGQLIVTNAYFNDRPIAVIVDTGSWVSVGNLAMRALATEPPRIRGPATITSVTGRSFTADFVTISNVKVGGVRFDNFGLVFADVPPFREFGLGDTPALILGMSTLELFQRVEIDFANREIAFTLPRPPIDFRSPCRSFSNCIVY